MMRICLLSSPFNMSSGLRISNTKNTRIAIKNRIDALTLLLYKVMISKATVIKTINEDITFKLSLSLVQLHDVPD